jgi:hypothetical protein
VRELTVDLRLSDVRDLFRPPDIDPLEAHFQTFAERPALEHVVDEFYAHPRARHVTLLVRLPPERLSPTLPEETRAAITRYADARAVAAKARAQRARYYGFRSGIVAVFGLFVLLGTAARLEASSDAFVAILGTGLGVVGWVLLWFPLDTLTYELWTDRVERRTYEALRAVDLRLIADEEDDRT